MPFAFCKGHLCYLKKSEHRAAMVGAQNGTYCSSLHFSPDAAQLSAYLTKVSPVLDSPLP